MQEKIKWLKRVLKDIMASKKVKKKKNLDPYDGGGSGGGRGLRPPDPLFHIYTFWNQKLCIYNLIFCANTIISSATRHHSNISLASTNNFWGILKAENQMVSP